MLYDALWMLLGLVCLVVGADALVRGASALAQKLGIRPAVVGLTVVAWGTSFPELMISVQASLGGYADLAIANVVGSNFYNITLIVGLSGLISQLPVQRDTLRTDFPAMFGATMALAVLAYDGVLSRVEGGLFVLALVAFTVYVLRSMPPEGEQSPMTSGLLNNPASAEQTSSPIALVLVGVGVVALGYGADWFTDGAVSIAHDMGVSRRVIGLTLVALGTSLPELATSVVAAARGHAEIAVSNVVGSNLLNILVIIGVAALIRPIPVSPEVVLNDMGALIGITALFGVFLWTHTKIVRWEGVVLLFLGVGYTCSLL